VSYFFAIRCLEPRCFSIRITGFSGDRGWGQLGEALYGCLVLPNPPWQLRAALGISSGAWRMAHSLTLMHRAFGSLMNAAPDRGKGYLLVRLP
jgi:hypothetical protein